MDSISEGKIRELFNNARTLVQNSTLYRRAPPLMQTAVMASVNMLDSSLYLLVGVIERKLLQWLRLTPKSTAKSPTSRVTSPAKAQPPAPHAPANQQGSSKTKIGDKGKNNPMRAYGAGVVQVGNQVLSVMQEGIGEHVADYHCHDNLGWGAKNGSIVKHDAGETTKAKLTDGGQLRQLSLMPSSRGNGIDAIWRSISPRPFAITEYKARNIFYSANAITRLLREEAVQDGDKKPTQRKAVSHYKRASKPGPSLVHPPQPLPKNIPKMSHKWIEDRVKNMFLLGRAVLEELKDKRRYSRYVILAVTTVGDVAAHVKELADAGAEKRAVNAGKHAAHKSGVIAYGEQHNIFTETPTKADTSTANNPSPGNTKSKSKSKSKQTGKK